MSGGAANTLWARALMDELARAGVSEVVVAPGSRSTPLVLAAAGDDRLRVRVHLDERSAGFFALGHGKATGRPAAVVTTSGTAAANVLPAVVEAAHSEAPLLVLTADRPPRLLGADANQTVEQVGLYGDHPVAAFALGLPCMGGPELRHLRSVGSRAAALAIGPPAGPVHLNCPFEKPLEPAEPDDGGAFAAGHPLAARGRPDGAPFVRIAPPAAARPDASTLDRLAAMLDASERTIVVAGPSPHPARGLLDLALRVGAPVLADPLSELRYGPAEGATVLGAYDLFLREQRVREALRPTLILRSGRTPTSAALQRFLAEHGGVPHVVVDAGRRWKDHQAVATEHVRADPDAFARALAERVSAGREDAEWPATWATVERAAREATEAPPEPHEGTVLAAVARAVPEGGCLVVSSSMPVRDLDAFGAPRPEPLEVVGNRGASGIDGMVSTAFGVAAARGAPTVCVLGDLAFFHDQNGLLWSREPDAEVVFVLVDNDGGGIFHMLAVREHEPHFTRYFATPHGLDFRNSAALHGLTLTDVDTGDVEHALAEACRTGGTRILRVESDRDRNHRAHTEAEAAARSAALRALGI